MHTHYYQFRANSHYELGLQMGEMFRDDVHEAITKGNHTVLETIDVHHAKQMYEITRTHFPNYIQEIEGYAKGAQIDIDSLWTLSLEDDLENISEDREKCTTLVTNGNLIIAHNEDTFAANHEKDICIVKRILPGYTSLELFYYNTIGGNAIGVNSFGFAQSVNTLHFQKRIIGVPKNIHGRFLQDTDNPARDIAFLESIPRTSGYNHNLIHKNGTFYNVESTSEDLVIERPTGPFVHTNHCLSIRGMKQTDDSGSLTRLERAKTSLRTHMSLDDIKTILTDASSGPDKSIYNARTIGSMIVDFASNCAYIWLLREPEKKWVSYPLDFI